MATNTTNYNLVKPVYADTADIADINGNMDIIDGQMKTNADGISSLQGDIGIVESGNTATHTISKGQYVVWKGSLYTADSAIPAGTAFATSGGSKNLSAVSGGGLNGVYSTLNGKMSELIYDIFTVNTNVVDSNNLFFRERLGIITVNGWLRLKNTSLTGGIVGNVLSSHRPASVVRVPCALSDNAYDIPKSMGYFAISDDGSVAVTTPNNNSYSAVYLSCSYIAQN